MNIIKISKTEHVKLNGKYQSKSVKDFTYNSLREKAYIIFLFKSRNAWISSTKVVTFFFLF